MEAGKGLIRRAPRREGGGGYTKAGEGDHSSAGSCHHLRRGFQCECDKICGFCIGNTTTMVVLT